MDMGHNMNVIFNAIDLINMTLLVTDYSRDIFKKCVSFISNKRFLTVFGAEDDLIEDLGVGTHKSLLNRFAVQLR